MLRSLYIKVYRVVRTHQNPDRQTGEGQELGEWKYNLLANTKRAFNPRGNQRVK